jgi:hypothetical protein
VKWLTDHEICRAVADMPLAEVYGCTVVTFVIWSGTL